MSHNPSFLIKKSSVALVASTVCNLFSLRIAEILLLQISQPSTIDMQVNEKFPSVMDAVWRMLDECIEFFFVFIWRKERTCAICANDFHRECLRETWRMLSEWCASIGTRKVCFTNLRHNQIHLALNFSSLWERQSGWRKMHAEKKLSTKPSPA